MQDDLLKLTDPSFFAEGAPHAVWRRLRAQDPVAWTPELDGPGFWSVTRYDDGVRVFKNGDTFSSAHGTLLEGNRWEDDPAAGKMLALMDPPLHTQMRQHLAPFFTPQRLGALEAGVQKIVCALVRRCNELGGFDFVAEIASRLPVSVLFTMVEIPPADWNHLSHTILRTVLSSETERRVADGEMLFYLSELAAERRRHPGDDLLSVIATMEPKGRRLTKEEVILNFANVISAGVDTTRLATSGGLFALLEHPEQWRLLRENPGMVTSAVEEIVRWTSPSLAFYRTATKDVTICGQRIKRGERVVVWLPSINRDERVFESPDSFNAARRPNPHIGFGIGGHYCLGAALARMEMHVLFRELVRQWKTVILAGATTRIYSLVLHGIDYLPVSVEVA